VRLASGDFYPLPGKKITFQKEGMLIYALCEGIKIGLASEIDEVVEPKIFSENFCGIITEVHKEEQMVLVRVLKNRRKAI